VVHCFQAKTANARWFVLACFWPQGSTVGLAVVSLGAQLSVMTDDKLTGLLTGGTLALIGAGLLAEMAKNIHDRYYKNQIVYLDGYTFTNCCFHNCTLVSTTGAFAINACTMASCLMQFGPTAMRLIKLYNVYNPTNPWPAFGPEIAPDGAVSIR
jgi:hypothetical protein